MKYTYLQFLPKQFNDNSRVWIYQCNRPLRDEEVLEIDEQLHNFYIQWTSHGAVIKGWAKCLYNQFIVIMADETASHVSGCSTDGMVRIIKSFEKQYGVELFDRLTITFLIDEKVQPLPMQQISYALEKGYIETDSLLFNNIIDTKLKLETEWLIPLNNSWLWSRVVASSKSAIPE
jgi:hypothetical protein